jgi:4-hydroxybutyrate CoA-transferase
MPTGHFLEKGTPVSIPRTDEQYVVTEYGVANFKGKNLRERARSLISIAHPNFRKELKKEAQIIFRHFNN